MRSPIYSVIAMLIILICAGILDVDASNPALAQPPTRLPTRLTNEYRGTLGSFPHSFIDPLPRIGDFFYFTNNDGIHGKELWRSDGTATGTAMVADLNQGEASSDPNLY